MASAGTKLQQQMQSLYAAHYGWLASWLTKKVKCHHNAEDIVQDTYVRMMTSNRIPDDTQARSFLVQIAKGLLIDRLRHRQVEDAYREALMLLPESSIPSVEDQIIAINQLVRIDSALSKLPEVVRQTFFLSQFDGYTYSEIAVKLKISVGSVRKYMLKALTACINATEQNEN